MSFPPSDEPQSSAFPSSSNTRSSTCSEDGIDEDGVGIGGACSFSSVGRRRRTEEGEEREEDE